MPVTVIRRANSTAAAVDPTITTLAELAAIPTVAQPVPAVKLWVKAADMTQQVWLLKAGTDATETDVVQRPTDYHATTNAKVWYRAG